MLGKGTVLFSAGVASGICSLVTRGAVSDGGKVVDADPVVIFGTLVASGICSLGTRGAVSGGATVVDVDPVVIFGTFAFVNVVGTVEF